MERKKQSKKAFVLNQPSDLSAQDVVKAAEAAGIKIPIGYVHNVRSQARRKLKRKGNGKKFNPATGKWSGPGRPSREQIEALASRQEASSLYPAPRSLVYEGMAGLKKASPAYGSASGALIQAIDQLIEQRVKAMFVEMAKELRGS